MSHKIVTRFDRPPAESAESDFCPPVGQKSTRGRPPKDVSQAEVADKLGISNQTLSNHLAYVAAVERYPELHQAYIPMKEALTMAQTLDALPTSVRAEKRAALRERRPNILEALWPKAWRPVTGSPRVDRISPDRQKPTRP
jgi:HTH DNA binding domain